MDFTLTDADSSLQERARRFAARIRERPGSPPFPWENFHAAAAEGLTAMTVPAEYGGMGASSVAYALAIEEVAKACPSTAVILSVHNGVAAWPLVRYGTEEQKERYLPRLASGKALGGYALTEPNSGSDAAAMTTTAARKGDNYHLNGSKVFISNACGDMFVVMATLDRGLGPKGITAFIVEKDFPGFGVGVHEKKMGLDISDLAEVVFTDCVVPASNRLGAEGEGFRIAMQALDGGRITIAAQAVGMAERALEETARLIREGEAAAGQGERFTLARMAAEVEAARHLFLRAAWAKDAALARGERWTREACMAKLYGAETAARCIAAALRLAGRAGVVPSIMERLYRDIKVTEIYEGTSEIQRLVIGRGLMERRKE